MSYKLGLILSFPFLMQMLLFCGDLSIVQSVHNCLDSLAQTVSILISQSGGVTDSIEDYCRERFEASFYTVDGGTGRMGDIVTFTLSKPYMPIIISDEEMFITVTRSAVIGYYS